VVGCNDNTDICEAKRLTFLEHHKPATTGKPTFGSSLTKALLLQR